MHRKILNKTKFLDRTNKRRKIQQKKAQETHTDTEMYTFFNRSSSRILYWKPQHIQNTYTVKENNTEHNENLP